MLISITLAGIDVRYLSFLVECVNTEQKAVKFGIPNNQANDQIPLFDFQSVPSPVGICRID
jgi:hypothetical protein